MPPSIRAVRELTEPQVRQLHALYMGEWWCNSRSLDDVQTLIRGGTLLLGLVHTESQELLAFARFITDGLFKAMLYDVIVHPDWRGQGLGRRLMDEIQALPDLQHIRHVDLHCLPPMVPFYQQWGFEVLQNDMVSMRRERPPA